MNEINIVELSGYAGNNPDYKRIGVDGLWASFSLGTHSFLKMQNGSWQRRTIWHNIEALGYNAKKVIDLVRVGSFVSLSGKLRSRTYKYSNGMEKTMVYISVSKLTSNI